MHSPDKKNIINQQFLQFSHKKTIQFKAQHPKWSLKYIEQKIKKEWESTIQANSQSMKKSSPKSKGNIQKDISEEQKRNDDIIKKLIYSQQKFKKEQHKAQSEELIELQISEPKMDMMKTKKIKKNFFETEYGKFYQFYQDKLESEHPSWTLIQIQNIINLLWKKKNKIDIKKIAQKARKAQAAQSKMAKAISGRALFSIEKKNQGLTNDEIQSLWRSFPSETKNHWMNKGKLPAQMVKKNKPEQIMKPSLLSFMNKTM